MAKHRGDSGGSGSVVLLVVLLLAVLLGAMVFRNEIQEALQGTEGTTTTATSTQGVTQWQTQTQWATPTQSAGRAPTQLTVMVSPNPMYMRGSFVGTITSDGQNYGITISYTTPRSESTSFRALLGPDGKYTSTPQQLNIPGEYIFSVQADNGVTSNTVQLQVEGVYINVEPNSVSRAFHHTITVEVATGMYRSNYVVTASKDGWATSIVVTTGRVDAHGYATWTDDWMPASLGNYEFDVAINGQTARSYGATDWLNVMR